MNRPEELARESLDQAQPVSWRFPTTRWTYVSEAVGDDLSQSRSALEQLCKSYWYPLYAYIRRKGHSADEALDVVQEYFAHLLEKGVIAAADPNRGRFRTFLMTDCSNFLSKRRAKLTAQKRGGGRKLVSIDVQDAEGRFLNEPADDLTPERLFQRTWTVTLLDRVLEILRDEAVKGGRAETFDRLKPVLTDGPGAIPYAQIAADLHTTEGAIQAAVHRLRKRYATLLREEIAATVNDPSDVQDEILALFAAFGT